MRLVGLGKARRKEVEKVCESGQRFGRIGALVCTDVHTQIAAVFAENWNQPMGSLDFTNHCRPVDELHRFRRFSTVFHGLAPF